MILPGVELQSYGTRFSHFFSAVEWNRLAIELKEIRFNFKFGFKKSTFLTYVHVVLVQELNQVNYYY